MDDRAYIEGEASLRDYARLLWHRRWYLVAPVLIALTAAVAYTMLVTPVYRAGTTLQVNASVIRPQEMDPFSGLFLSREAVASFVELSKTPTILDRVAFSLEATYPGEGLGTIGAAQVGSTEFFTISVENANPALARDVANEIASALKQESLLEWQSRLAQSELLLRLQQDRLQTDIEVTRLALLSGSGDPQLLSLELSQYEAEYASVLRTLEGAQLASSRVTDVLTVRASATTPTAPVHPRPLTNLGIALLLGFALGTGLVFSVEYFDTKVKTPDQVRQLLGVPIMGALPVAPDGEIDKETGLLDVKSLEGSPLMESYHLLRTNLRFSWENADPKAILVTSAEAGEGKTTVLSHLGIALAMAGQRVILVDADLRRPQLHQRFGLSFEKGLTQAMDDEDLQLEDYLKPTEVPNLRVITAGSYPANPTVLLGSGGMNRVLDASKRVADVVLVDSPPRPLCK